MEKTESTYTLSAAESVPSLHHQTTYSRNVGLQVPPSVKHKIKVTVDFIRNLKLEAFLLVYVMAFSMRLMITQDLLLTKVNTPHS